MIHFARVVETPRRFKTPEPSHFAQLDYTEGGGLQLITLRYIND